MFCERCGSEIAETAVQCPLCGANSFRRFKNNAQPTTNYGRYPEDTPPYQQGYTASSETPPLYKGAKDAREFSQQNRQIPQPPYRGEQMQYAGSAPANPGLNVVKVSTKNNNALIVEIILSLFGLFGVGWLIAGETTVGTVLLICSIFIYWPLLILGTIFTFGLGLICLGPLAIGVIILNILLLNKVLEQKSTQYVITPQPIYMNTSPRQ